MYQEGLSVMGESRDEIEILLESCLRKYSHIRDQPDSIFFCSSYFLFLLLTQEFVTYTPISTFRGLVKVELVKRKKRKNWANLKNLDTIILLSAKEYID